MGHRRVRGVLLRWATLCCLVGLVAAVSRTAGTGTVAVSTSAATAAHATSVLRPTTTSGPPITTPTTELGVPPPTTPPVEPPATTTPRVAVGEGELPEIVVHETQGVAQSPDLPPGGPSLPGPEPTAAINGVVVDENGEPLPDICIHGNDTAPYLAFTRNFTARTDAAGRFSAPVTPGHWGAYAVECEPAAPGRVASSFFVDVTDFPVSVHMVLPTGAVLRARVLFPPGFTGSAFIQVQVGAAWFYDIDGYAPPDHPEATLIGLPEGIGEIRITCFSPEGCPFTPLEMDLRRGATTTVTIQIL